MNALRILSLALVLGLFSSCANVYPEPKGSPTAAKIISNKHFETKTFSGEIMATKVDGLLVSYPPFKGPFAVVEPGIHDVQAAFYGTIHSPWSWNKLVKHDPNLSTADLRADLAPSTTYLLKARTEDQTIYFWLENAKTGEPASSEAVGANRYFEGY